MTRVPKQVYTVLGLQGPKFQIFMAKFYKPLFRSILPKSTHFSKSFGCLAASTQPLNKTLLGYLQQQTHLETQTQINF